MKTLSKLGSLSLTTESRYEGGMKDTISHYILNCPIFNLQRFVQKKVIQKIAERPLHYPPITISSSPYIPSYKTDVRIRNNINGLPCGSPWA
ncbi:hypothetical protein HZH68_009189 [Vespula germanica]|uniref:Uncharacterized protein n=1 Tax=Vespula germanica TaxID=30212 RepID=A0A834N6F2_VESGE|nr:hypothetical protein HZH68_009189 [Vespula germanica]